MNETVIVLISLCIAIVLGMIMVAIAIHMERKDYNNGKCPRCGQSLEFRYTDSHGDRCYWCNGCGYHTWVSYSSVDLKKRR
mgnify:CR=1 FL=1